MTTPALNLGDALTAFRAAARPDPREGLQITAEVQNGELRVQVRFQDVDALRGFDLVAQPLASEHRSAAELGQAVAEVLHRELMYAQLPAAHDDGSFRRTVI
jgi:hypothetical protein